MFRSHLILQVQSCHSNIFSYIGKRASCDIKMHVCYLCFTLLCCKRLRVRKSNRSLEKNRWYSSLYEWKAVPGLRSSFLLSSLVTPILLKLDPFLQSVYAPFQWGKAEVSCGEPLVHPVTADNLKASVVLSETIPGSKVARLSILLFPPFSSTTEIMHIQGILVGKNLSFTPMLEWGLDSKE